MTLRRGKPMKRTGRLNPVSDKKRILDAILAVNSERRRRMAHDLCEANVPGCPSGPHRGWHAHHVRRRKGQPDVHAVEHLRWVCFDGHDWIHAEVAESKKLGLLA